jgi:2-dehydro-3-deoxygluconokinase
MRNKIAVIGECMLEVSSLAGGDKQQSFPAQLSYGGDTLNTSIYLARLGVEVDYVSALGDDSMSAWMLAQWREEGVGCNLVARYPDSVPGLYMIQVDDQGERSFLYWRENSPATRLFDDPVAASELFDKLLGYPQIYLSGITLALYAEPARHRLFDFLARYRDQGGKVIFDGNYRPRLWTGPEVARDAYEHMYRVCDLVLPTDEDEAMLFGVEEPEAVLSRLRSYGVGEVVLKMGPNGCWIGSDSETEWLASESVEVVDSTAAGDSFNAGYMAAKFGGSTAADAAKQAHKLASTVIRYRGAIIPAAAMPS